MDNVEVANPIFRKAQPFFSATRTKEIEEIECLRHPSEARPEN